LLRNGWYSENYAASAAPALANGAHYGCAGEGRISSAPRADFAAAAAAVMASDEDQAGKIYELAGDESFTLAEFAAEIARQSGKTVNYVNLPEADYAGALVGIGLPEPLAAMLANSDTGASKGGLFDDGHQMSALIGRKTTPIADTIAKALAQ
jgi:NAD(P)H dehydrogenase (quinone)